MIHAEPIQTNQFRGPAKGPVSLTHGQGPGIRTRSMAGPGGPKMAVQGTRPESMARTCSINGPESEQNGAAMALNPGTRPESWPNPARSMAGPGGPKMAVQGPGAESGSRPWPSIGGEFKAMAKGHGVGVRKIPGEFFDRQVQSTADPAIFSALVVCNFPRILFPSFFSDRLFSKTLTERISK